MQLYRHICFCLYVFGCNSIFIFNREIGYYYSKLFFSVGNYIIKKIKKRVNQLLQLNYLEVNDLEKIVIANKIDEILRVENLMDRRTRHPIIHQLIVNTENYLDQERVILQE
jgi:hypothetical protein